MAGELLAAQERLAGRARMRTAWAGKTRAEQAGLPANFQKPRWPPESMAKPPLSAEEPRKMVRPQPAVAA